MINIDKIISAAATAEPIKISKRDYSTDGYTAFAVFAVVRDTMKQLNIPFDGTSQQFYGYAKSGKINGVKSSTQRYSEDEVEKFVARYIANFVKSSKK